MVVLKSKELIIKLKEICLDLISNGDRGFYPTYNSIHNYIHGLSLGFFTSKRLTEKEYSNFKKWLVGVSSVKYEKKTNIGTFFKPKYEIKKMYKWRSWY